MTAPNRRGRIPAGIRAHRDGALSITDRTSIRGIPCTSVARTLLDLAGIVPIWELRKAIAEAEVLRVFDLAAVRDVIKRGRGRRGVARLRTLVAELDFGKGIPNSVLERRFLSVCERASVPPPEVNQWLRLRDRTIKPDFTWRDARLVIETDGGESHDTKSSFESDRRRDQALAIAGWQVVRFTWHQVFNEPARVGQTLGELYVARVRRRP